MHYYVYDEYVQGPKFEKQIAKIETRLTDLGISGKIARLALFRDAAEFIRDEVKRGVNTVIAVGNDRAIRKVIDTVVNEDVVVGIIPIGGKEQQIAEMLGIPEGVEACEVISARIVDDLDTGVANAWRFLHQCEFSVEQSVKIICDQSFTVFPRIGSQVQVRNLANGDDQLRVANPTDGKLELIVRTLKRNWFGRMKEYVSIIPFTDAVCEFSGPMKITIDGEGAEVEDLTLGIEQKNIRCITSRKRLYGSA